MTECQTKATTRIVLRNEHMNNVVVGVVFLSHYAEHLIVAVSIFPIESSELSLNARWIVFTIKIFLHQKYFSPICPADQYNVTTTTFWLLIILSDDCPEQSRPCCLFVARNKQTLITTSHLRHGSGHGGILSNGNFTFLLPRQCQWSNRVKTTTSPHLSSETNFQSTRSGLVVTENVSSQGISRNRDR